MRVIALVLIACIIGANTFIISDEWMKTIEGFKKRCIREIGIDKDIAHRIVRNETIERDSKTDCFSACFVDRVVKFRGEGQIDIGSARKSAREEGVDVEKIINVMEKCNGLFGKDFCETGYNTLKCLVADDNFPKLYIETSKEL